MLPDLPTGKNCDPGVEVKLASRIVKRAGAAQIVEAVFLEEPTDFGRAFRRSLGGGEPALHFRREVVICAGPGR